MNRRRLLKSLGWLAVARAARKAGASALGMPHIMSAPIPEQLLDTSRLARWVDPLPMPSLLKPTDHRPNPRHPPAKIPYYRVEMRQFDAKVHRDMPPATFWGYNASSPGPTIEARSGEPIQVEWVNSLPAKHLFPIDRTLCGAETGTPDVRTIVHLHGAKTGPESDGYPEHWFVPGQSGTCYYPNGQESCSLFYHDHAMGITRLNAAAGLMGMYLIRDQFEESLNLPRGAYEISLVLFDRSFHQDGRLYYPVSGKPDAPWVSEYYGSAILANGKIFPFLEVEPRKYRFRLLNSSNGSFYRLSVGAEASVAAPGIEFHQIGSEQGLLEAPASLTQLIVGPGGRADLIVDFRRHPGKELYLRTDVAMVMQFRVAASGSPDTASLPSALRPMTRLPEQIAARTRTLTVADYQDRLGRSHMMLLNGARWHMPVTENPVLDSTEIWSFLNLTDDSHPIHLHMVRFQILDRRPFDLTIYQLTKKVVYTGPPVELTPDERGWKDTVRIDPMTMTRIIVRFEGFTGRYVWHCHMLEHEDNEMMRPYEVVAG
jgi:spore coat protein A